MSRLVHALALCVVLGGWIAPALAAAPANPPYPAVRTVETVRQWAAAHTDISPSAIVAFGQESLFAVEPARGAPAGRTTIRQEALDPDFSRRLGGRSAVMTIDLDCAGHRALQRDLVLYPGANLQGPARQLGPGTGWRNAARGSYMDAVLSAACDPGHRPLYPADAKLAANAPPRAPAAPMKASRVEYGRFPSLAAALQAAQALDRALPDAMAGKLRRIEPIAAGARTEFRGLLEGFATPAEADAFCRRLEAAGRPCAAAR